MCLLSRLTKLAACSVAYLILLSACAGQKKAQGPVFFPPAPNLPRIQYLTGITSSQDVEGAASSLSLLSFGGADQKKLRPIIKPYGVAAAKGKIYVADIAGQVLIIDLPNKSFEKLKGDNGVGKLKKPINLAVDAQGFLYVADNGRKEVLVYDAQGEFVRSVGRDFDLTPGSVAVDEDRIYILDVRKGFIQVVDRVSFERVKEIGKNDDPAQSLSLPISMALDGKGVLHVTNAGTGKVMSFDRDGHFLSSFGQMGDGFGQFSRPKGIAADQNGNLMVVDAAFQNVQVLTDKGRVLMFFGGAEGAIGGMNLPAGITTSSDNMEYYQKLADKNFELEQIVLVVNQFGNPKIGIYGFGKQKGIDYEKEYQRVQSERERKARELMEKGKAAGGAGKEPGAAGK